MTCRDCKNYKECDKNKNIKIEIFSNGFLKQPRLCNYVECICKDYIANKGGNDIL